jgi:FG-GAP-like repeat
MLSTPVPASSPGTVAPRTVSFIARRDFAAGINPQSVVVGDFNGDGVPDLAVANFGSSSVSVLLGRGDGTFQAALDFDVGNRAWSVAVGDFNGDGVLDLAVAGNPNVAVLLGNGDGTFRLAVNFAAGTIRGS